MALVPLVGEAGSELDAAELGGLVRGLKRLNRLNIGYCSEEWPTYMLFHDTPLHEHNRGARDTMTHIIIVYYWMLPPRRWNSCTERYWALNEALASGLRLRPNNPTPQL